MEEILIYGGSLLAIFYVLMNMSKSDNTPIKPIIKENEKVTPVIKKKIFKKKTKVNKAKESIKEIPKEEIIIPKEEQNNI
jgi:hypothetical protein